MDLITPTLLQLSHFFIREGDFIAHQLQIFDPDNSLLFTGLTWPQTSQLVLRANASQLLQTNPPVPSSTDCRSSTFWHAEQREALKIRLSSLSSFSNLRICGGPPGVPVTAAGFETRNVSAIRAGILLLKFFRICLSRDALSILLSAEENN
jgi:hypothetical protein